MKKKIILAILLILSLFILRFNTVDAIMIDGTNYTDEDAANAAIHDGSVIKITDGTLDHLRFNNQKDIVIDLNGNVDFGFDAYGDFSGRIINSGTSELSPKVYFYDFSRITLSIEANVDTTYNGKGVANITYSNNLDDGIYTNVSGMVTANITNDPGWVSFYDHSSGSLTTPNIQLLEAYTTGTITVSRGKINTLSTGYNSTTTLDTTTLSHLYMYDDSKVYLNNTPIDTSNNSSNHLMIGNYMDNPENDKLALYASYPILSSFDSIELYAGSIHTNSNISNFDSLYTNEDATLNVNQNDNVYILSLKDNMPANWRNGLSSRFTFNNVVAEHEGYKMSVNMIPFESLDYPTQKSLYNNPNNTYKEVPHLVLKNSVSSIFYDLIDTFAEENEITVKYGSVEVEIYDKDDNYIDILTNYSPTINIELPESFYADMGEGTFKVYLYNDENTTEAIIPIVNGRNITFEGDIGYAYNYNEFALVFIPDNAGTGGDESDYVPGDWNNDGVVDGVDLANYRKYIAGNAEVVNNYNVNITEEHRKALDMNDDKAIGLVDLVKVRAIAAN